VGDVTLQPRTISTVKATAPVLREHGLEITQRMYELLFQDEQIKSLSGQYLTFQLDIPGHGQLVRNYSVSCAPARTPATFSWTPRTAGRWCCSAAGSGSPRSCRCWTRWWLEAVSGTSGMSMPPCPAASMQ
jgi:hypothetical protein